MTRCPPHRENRENGHTLCQGKNREFGNVAKTQGVWFDQVVNSLILKIKYISILAMKIFNFILKLDKTA